MRCWKFTEVWHWEETSNELFSGYVNTFLKLKQEASGYPKHCVTDEQKQRYIDQYYKHEGVRLDPNKIEYKSRVTVGGEIDAEFTMGYVS